MVHKPKHKVHSFRGLMADESQFEVNLERQNVNVAYRIIKFELLPPDANTALENTVKIYKDEQTTIDRHIDLGDPDILAAGIIQQSVSTQGSAYSHVIIDNILFSRNIFITHMSESAGIGKTVNFYVEIEEVPVTAATLMQIKLGTARRLVSAKMGA